MGELANLFDDPDDAKTRAGINLRFGVDAQPDAAARNNALARRFGLPAGVVEQYKPEYEAQAKVQDAMPVLEQSPALRGWLAADANRAKVAHDDVGLLGSIETTVAAAARYVMGADDRGGLPADVGQFGRALAAGVVPRFGAAAYGAAAYPLEALGLTGAGGQMRNLQRQSNAEADAWRGSLEDAGLIRRGMVAGAESAGQTLVTLPLGFARMAAVTGEQAMLAAMGALTFGQTYGKARDKGLSVGQSGLYGMQDAAAEIVTEKFLGAAKMVADAKAGSSLVRLFMRDVARDIPGESAATVWQNFNEWANVNPDKRLAEWLAEQPAAIAETIVATIVGAGAQTGAIRAVQRATGDRDRQQAIAAATDQRAQALVELSTLSEASKLRERDPDEFLSLVEKQASEGGLPHIYVDAQVLQQSGIDIQAAAQALPSVAAQIEQAIATGGDLVIPTSEFLTLAAGQPFAAGIIENARTRPDAMSAAEAKAYMSERGDALQTEIESVMGRRETDQATEDARGALREGFAQQLQAAGRQPQAAQQEAALLEAFFTVNGQRMGMTGTELAQRYQVQVQGKMAEGAAVYEQAEAASAVDTGKRSPLTGKPLIDVLDAAGNKIETTHIASTPDEALQNYRERPARQAAARAAAPAPTYYLPERPAKDQGSNWRRVSGQEFTSLDEDDAYLYHITSAPAAKGVRQDGLVPNAGGMFGGFYANYSAGKVFVTERSGVSYWQEKVEQQLAHHMDNQPAVVVLRIPKDKVQGKLQADEVGSSDAGAPAYFSTGVLRQGPRAQVAFPANLTDAPSIITMLKDADLSSFIHEAGHFFLQAQVDMAARIEAQQQAGASVTAGEQQILADARVVLDWFGIKGTEQTSALTEWLAMPLEQQREHHEKWARGFESYAFEGKSPSIELQGAFQRFRAWMLQVYKNLTALNVTLTDEVRGVMDRMLASEQQIAEAEAARRMGPLFETAEQAGMTPEQFDAYHAQALDATQEAIQNLQARGLRDMKWLSNAKSRKLKELQKTTDGLRRQTGMDVRAEVMAEPVYRAWQWLTTKDDGRTPTGPTAESAYKLDLADWQQKRKEFVDEATKAERVRMWEASPQSQAPGVTPLDKGQFINRHKREVAAAVEVDALEWENENPPPERPASVERPQETSIEMGSGKLHTGILRDRYGTKPDAIWRTLSALRMTSEERGADPDVVAETFGFTSGDEMIQALAVAEPPNKVIEERTDQRMLEQHGDLATPEGLQRAVDDALQTEARARFIATELEALERANRVREKKPGQRSTVDVLAKAARSYAQGLVARLRVRDIRPQQYQAAEARASKAAQKALAKGDTAEAATQKRNQLIQHAAARAASEAQAEVEQARSYFTRFNKRIKALDASYQDQIDALLEKFDFRRQSDNTAERRSSMRTWVQARLNDGEIPDIAETLLSADERAAYLAAVQSRDADGELVYRDDESAVQLLADAIDRSARRPYRDMTVEELRGLVDTIKHIEHLGRLKGRMLTTRGRQAYEAVRDEMAASVVDNAGAGGKNKRTATDWLGARLQTLAQFAASHIKVASWARRMDGGQDNGAVWRYLVMPANERASMETTMRAQATQALDDILRPVLAKVGAMDKVGKGRFFATINDSLNWQERFTMALNVGNESNLQRLLGGKGWSMEQVLPVLRSLSAQEWRAVQAVWDHFESYRPQIGAKERRVNGKEPRWIEARPFDVTTADGQTISLRGGYYPVKFDPRVNQRAGQHSAAEEAKTLLSKAYSAATTRRSFVKNRVDEVRGRPLLLSLQGLYSGINDVIHDLAWHEWVIDANRLLKSDKLDGAIREHYGPEVKKEIERWRDDIVAGTARADHAVEVAARWARQSVTASALTFNLVSAAMQPLGLANSISRVGAHWIGRGVMRYIGSPIAATREAQALSPWLANRTRTRFRELNELRNQIQGQTAAKELMGRYGYWMMMRTQLMVDVPTWWGAYEKALAGGLEEDTAIAVADQAVKDAQGGGEEVDQSGVERGGPLIKLFTAFYGFMGTTLNVAYLNATTEKNRAKMAANAILVLAVPAILGSLLKDALIPGDAGDEEDLAKKLAAEQISFLMGTVAFGREFAQAGKVLLGEGGGMGYSGPAGLRLIPDTIKLSQQAAQGEFDDAFRKAFVNVAGDLTGIPSVQINRTITGAQALADGKTANPAALAFGFQEPR